MNEEYLWDKTGKDPEIESLEKALSAFRYKETEPPALPSNVIAFKSEKKSSRKGFLFGLAVAACLAFVVVALGAWLQVSNQQPKGEGLAEMELIKENFVSEDDLKIKEDETNKQTPIKPIAKIRKAVVAPLSETQARSNKVKLTKEEQYAYDQLMRALTITSSKLNLVKKKVQGEEEQKTAVKEGS